MKLNALQKLFRGVTDYALHMTFLTILIAVDALNELKKKVIQEFNTLLSKVRKGYKLDYEFILEEISFIELTQYNELDNNLSLTALQYYLNNKWQMNQS